MSLFVLMSCKKQDDTNELNSTDKELSINFVNNNSIPVIEDLYVNSKGIESIKIGDRVENHKNKIQKVLNEKSDKKDKENRDKFQLFNNKKEEIGTVYSQPNHKDIIGRIEINSPKYKSIEGIHVGSTFSELKKAYPNSTSHRCNNDEKTAMYTKGMYFLLSNLSTSDESKIDPLTKVEQIIIIKKR